MVSGNWRVDRIHHSSVMVNKFSQRQWIFLQVWTKSFTHTSKKQKQKEILSSNLFNHPQTKIEVALFKILNPGLSKNLYLHIAKYKLL